LSNLLNRKTLRAALFIIGLGFFLGMLVVSWEEMGYYLTRINWPLFILSILLGMLDFGVAGNVFDKLLRKFSIELEFPLSYKMYIYGQAAKYIPGRLWNVLFHLSYLDKPNSTLILLVVNIEHLLMFMVRNLGLGLVMLLAGFSWLATLGVYVAFLIIFELTGRSGKLLSLVLGIVRRFNLSRTTIELEKLNTIPEKPVFAYSYLLATLTFIIPNLLFLYAVFGISLETAWINAAVFSISWVCGALTIFVPAGIGVREVIFVFLVTLSGLSVETATLTAIAVSYRFWGILQELACVVFTYIFTFRKTSA